MSDINAPHPNDIGEPPAPPAAPDPAAGPSGPPSTSEPPAPEPMASEPEEPAVSGGVASPADTPPPLEPIEPIEPPDPAAAQPTQPAAASPQSTGGQPAAAAPDPAGADEPKRSTEHKPYVVVQELQLTEGLLRNLLAELAQGQAPRRIVWYLDEEKMARNADHALYQVREEQGERLGPRPKLMAVTRRSWRMVTPQPRPPRPPRGVEFVPAD